MDYRQKLNLQIVTLFGLIITGDVALLIYLIVTR